MKNAFRHEQKYICSYEQMMHLKTLLHSLLPCDEHSLNNTYHIGSLYFDTHDDRFFMESINGLPYRKKYRIRCYNYETEKLKLECKESYCGMKRKEFIHLHRQEAEVLINNTAYQNDKVFEDFYYLQKTELLKPKIVINYDRTAFVDRDLNVRITLDMNVTASQNENSLRKKEAEEKPIINTDTGILEVKYDSCCPDYIIRLLRSESLEQTSFSKYVIGRQALEPSLNYLK